MDLSTSAVVFLFLTYHLCEAGDREYNSVLIVPNGGHLGGWGNIEPCPSGHAYGFSLKVQEKQGMTTDDTGPSLTGIGLHCSSGAIVTSTVRPWGNWTDVKKCPAKTYLVAFALRTENKNGIPYDEAASNIQFSCGNGTVLEGEGLDLGTYDQWSKRCTSGAICAIQTMFDFPGPLHNVRFLCCD